MTETELKNLLKTVAPPDEAARAAAHAHWAALAKPLGGLGQLETMVEAAAALTGDPAPDFTRPPHQRLLYGGCGPLRGRPSGHGHCGCICTRRGGSPRGSGYAGLYPRPGYDP